VFTAWYGPGVLNVIHANPGFYNRRSVFTARYGPGVLNVIHANPGFYNRDGVCLLRGTDRVF
jgi:hypothetical protein